MSCSISLKNTTLCVKTHIEQLDAKQPNRKKKNNKNGILNKYKWRMHTVQQVQQYHNQEQCNVLQSER